MKRPAGWHTLTPRIITDDVEGLVKFIQRVFGAEGDYHEERPSELRIGDSMLMVSGDGVREGFAAFLYVYVDDADATYQRAIDAGATELETPRDLPYGDRRGMVRDAWGNIWQIATFHGR
jgi:PhnB protein